MLNFKKKAVLVAPKPLSEVNSTGKRSKLKAKPRSKKLKKRMRKKMLKFIIGNGRAQLMMSNILQLDVDDVAEVMQITLEDGKYDDNSKQEDEEDDANAINSLKKHSEYPSEEKMNDKIKLIFEKASLRSPVKNGGTEEKIILDEKLNTDIKKVLVLETPSDDRELIKPNHKHSEKETTKIDKGDVLGDTLEVVPVMQDNEDSGTDLTFKKKADAQNIEQDLSTSISFGVLESVVTESSKSNNGDEKNVLDLKYLEKTGTLDSANTINSMLNPFDDLERIITLASRVKEDDVHKVKQEAKGHKFSRKLKSTFRFKNMFS